MSLSLICSCFRYDVHCNTKGACEQGVCCVQCQTHLSLCGTTCQRFTQQTHQPRSVSETPPNAPENCSSDSSTDATKSSEHLQQRTEPESQASCSVVSTQEGASTFSNVIPIFSNGLAKKGPSDPTCTVESASNPVPSDLSSHNGNTQSWLHSCSCAELVVAAQTNSHQVDNTSSELEAEKGRHETTAGTGSKRPRSATKPGKKRQGQPQKKKKVSSSKTSKENSLSDGPFSNHNIPESADPKGRYVCTVCSATLGCLNRLRTHYRRAHTFDRPYTCELCDSAFAELFDLKRHVNNRHVGSRPYACSDCEKAYFDSNTLKRHTMRSHTQERPHACQICPTAFLEKSELSKHMQRLHGEERAEQGGSKKANPKPYLCSHCGAGFWHKCSLESHMHKHSGLKPFSCSVCGNAFRAKSTLRCHMRIHTNDRRFICEQCGEKYITKSGLTVHKRKHSGDKPYLCEACAKGFYISGDLKRHRKRCMKLKVTVQKSQLCEND